MASHSVFSDIEVRPPPPSLPPLAARPRRLVLAVPPASGSAPTTTRSQLRRLTLASPSRLRVLPTRQFYHGRLNALTIVQLNDLIRMLNTQMGINIRTTQAKKADIVLRCASSPGGPWRCRRGRKVARGGRELLPGRAKAGQGASGSEGATRGRD